MAIYDAELCCDQWQNYFMRKECVNDLDEFEKWMLRIKTKNEFKWRQICH